MIIKIQAFRRLKQLSFETGKKITLIAGKIEQGKTSILQAIGIALTGESIFKILGITEKQNIMLLHTGQPKSTVMIERSDGIIGVSFPDGKKVSEGNPPEISIWGSGLKNILDEPIKSRADIFAEILKTVPTKELFFSNLSELTNSEASMNKIWDTIEVSGWNAAHQHAKETGSKLKGQWENITGKSFGKRIAETYVPDEWDFDLTDANEEQLQTAVNEEQEWLEVAIASETIDSIDRVKIEDAKQHIDIWKNELNKNEEKIQSFRKSYTNTKAALNNMPEAKQPTIQKCPNCSIDLAIVNGSIKKAENVEQSIIDQRKKDIKELEKTLEQINKEAQKMSAEQIDIKVHIEMNEKIIKNGEIEKKSTNKKSKATSEECRKYLKKAEDRLLAFQKKKQADGIYNKISVNQKIIDILAPDGLRLKELHKKIDGFNNILSEICKTTAWGDIYLNKDMTVNHRGWSYPNMISGSAIWRVNISIQLAIAQVMNDFIVLIDGADILDSEAKNGLFKLLNRAPFQSIVSMTMSKKEDVPNLEKIGGKTIWVEDGRVL